jgi:hypothetical protein
MMLKDFELLSIQSTGRKVLWLVLISVRGTVPGRRDATAIWEKSHVKPRSE